MLIIVAAVGIIAILTIRLAHTQADNRVLASDNQLQGKVIATQAFNFNRFNQIAEHANRLNSLIDISTEETVIKYREILRREKTCDLPVPPDIAGGLLEYAHRLRASALHTDTNRPDAANDSTATANAITYCQAVLWIKPLLAAIEKGNNNFAGIRDIEQQRQKPSGAVQ
ncbi:hypothetical protein [Enterobacter sp. P82]|uniref:hypothetical protein n=1 Tax=Enterobacter sp. P82 TaxID=3123033 RepID=UPI00300C0FF6